MPEIIAAVGDHPHPTAALRWAAMLTRHSDDDLVAVTVFQRPYSEMDPDQHDELVAERESRIHDTVAETGARAATIEVLEGDPHSKLAARINRPGVEYVVVGQHDSGGFGGQDTAHHLIHHTDRPVVAVSDEAELTSGPVVVGVDGSPTNAQALAVAKRLAGQLDSELIAAFCPDPADGSAEGEPYDHEQAVRRELGDLLHPEDVLLIEPGHPTETLSRIASRRGASALIVGTRGKGGFHGLIAGRVATQLLRHSPVPVIVVPHASE